jgi:hydrogenase nickel incorporation protein HypA/HybF
LVEGIVKQIESQKKKHSFSRVNSVHLVCGKYNCLSEETLQFCFDAVTRLSYMEGARLKVTRTAGRCRCDACGAEARGEQPCPSCGSHEIIPIVDDEIYIRALEVE